jgi:uncharacterized RDD family membrane protein YckC
MELSPSMVVEVASNSSAGFGIRVAARLIDAVFGVLVGFLGGAIGGLLAGILASMGHVQGDWLANMQQASLAGYALGLVGSVLYQVTADAVGGASVGKLILGLRVTSEDLTPCTFRGALIRNTAYFVDAFFFGIPAYVAMSNSLLSQRYGDRWGRTVVMRASAVPPDSRKGMGLIALGIFSGAAIWGFFIALTIFLRVR